MKSSVKKLLITCGVIAACIVVLILLSMRPVENFHEKYEGADLSAEVAGAVREGTYTRYQLAHQDAAAPAVDVDVDLCSYIEGTDVEVYQNYKGEAKALYTGADSKVTWEFNVPQTGLYNVYLEYMTVESRGVSIERCIYFNGRVPFDDAANLSFTRMWTDGALPKVDNQGNEIRPVQVEVYDWQSAYCRDDMGYVIEPYQFYLEKGKNTVSLEAVNEPMVLRRLVIKGIEPEKSYQEYRAAQTGSAAKGEGLTYYLQLEGEKSARRSDPSLYAKYDKSVPNTHPYSVMNTILNYTGGDAWRTSGQWIEWDFTVPEDGFYNIMVKGRQNYARGSVSCRSLYIDGKIPFDEMKEIAFDYQNGWNCLSLDDENGKPYEFYLKAGAHTVRLEATLGGMGAILEELEDSTFRLNQVYRRLLVYTGASPDTYRDYHIEQVYPESIAAMEIEAKRLYKIVDDTVAYTGQKADQIASAQTLAKQLERFVDRPEKITREFTTFKDNITALGTAILNMTEIKLDIDYLVVTGTGVSPKKDTANFFSKAWHEIKAFVASFIVDYNAVGDVYEEGKNEDIIKVWVTTGRDQGTILKAMVDDTFTPESGIKVNVEIVDGGALLSAVLAGRGPDVVLSVGADQPVNYALRGSAEDITQFSDYKEVLAPYTESSYIQYCLDDAIYGMPETQTFSVMFYRKDVLEELGLEIPQTWQDLIEMLPTIQGNSLSVGIPSAAGSSGAVSTAVASTSADLTMYFSLLYQYGGDVYNVPGTKTTVNEENAVRAFDEYTRYFTDYGIPTVFDFVSRFRSGEMPIGIMPYSIYNTLMVSAPEIRGLWDFTLIPGTEKTDANGKTFIDRSDFISGSATMMIKIADENRKQKAWEFMKWWAKAETQVRYGREIEALLGSSARYATANRDAFVQLAWTAKDIKVLQEQWEWTRGIREVPGGYYTGRHITNAIRKVINEQSDPRETIIDYTIKINDELTKKRKEFGLWVEE